MLRTITSKILIYALLSRLPHYNSMYKRYPTADSRQRHESAINRYALLQHTFLHINFYALVGKIKQLSLSLDSTTNLLLLYDEFSSCCVKYTPYSIDSKLGVPRRTATRRTRKLRAAQCFARFLTKDEARRQIMTLCTVFGVSRSVALFSICFTRPIVYKSLCSDDKNCARLPSNEKFQQ